MGMLEIDGSDMQPEALSDCQETSGYAVTYASGIRKLKNIDRFLGVADVVSL